MAVQVLQAAPSVVGEEAPAVVEADEALPADHLPDELVRQVLTLTWNGPNELGSGHETPGGLTAFGREAVAEMERLGPPPSRPASAAPPSTVRMAANFPASRAPDRSAPVRQARTRS